MLMTKTGPNDATADMSFGPYVVSVFFSSFFFRLTTILLYISKFLCALQVRL